MATNSNTADDAIFDNDSDVTDVDTGAVGVAAVRTPTAPVPDCACWAVMENYAALITEATHVDDRVGGAPVTDAVVKEGGDVAAVATVDEFDVVEVVATQLFKCERGTLHRVDAGGMHGVPVDQAAAASRAAIYQHNNVETPLFAKSIERKALAAAGEGEG